MLNAERSTLFLNDEKTGELFSMSATSSSTRDPVPEPRRHRRRGVHDRRVDQHPATPTPTCASTRRSTSRPAISRARSCACPIVNKRGTIIGVTQVLNKRGGPFTAEDESRLRAFTAQISIALENAKLFADVQNMKNYNEAMLESMSNGVITFDERGHRADLQRRGEPAHPAREEADVVGDVVRRSCSATRTRWLRRAHGSASARRSAARARSMDAELQSRATSPRR